MKHQHQAGFIPPLVSIQTSSSSSYLPEQSDSDTSLDEHSFSMNNTSDYLPSSSNRSGMTSAGRKSTGRMGGRRPNNNLQVRNTLEVMVFYCCFFKINIDINSFFFLFFSQLTPEEAERRELRRERNKLAAARCRKRRMDHTNILVQVG